MSTRRERREQQRHQEKQKREINWGEVKKTGKILMIISLVLALLLTPLMFYGLYHHNQERRKISVDPTNTTAVITHIYSGKRSGNYATYSFNVSGTIYTGSTSGVYKGFVGDSVDITFNRTQPSLSMLRRDMSEQTVRSMVQETSTTIIGLIGGIFAFTILYSVFKILTGDKEWRSEFTRKAG